MVAEVINEYEMLARHVTELIERSGFRVDFVRQKLGLSKPGFYKKRKAGNFSPEEMRTVLTIIKADDLEEKMFIDIMDKAKVSGRLTEKETKALFASIK
jgi:hypothetical protein